MKNKQITWNGNELVFAKEPTIGVAGIASNMPDELGKEIAERWNKGIICKNGCKYDDTYGFVPFNDCPIHD